MRLAAERQEGAESVSLPWIARVRPVHPPPRAQGAPPTSITGAHLVSTRNLHQVTAYARLAAAAALILLPPSVEAWPRLPLPLPSR